MEIRKAKMEEIDVIMNIFARARAFMAESGNPNQWGNNKPERETIEEDIKLGRSYVCVENGKNVATFFYMEDEDPTYNVVYGGEWLNPKKYGVVHRIASAGTVKGAGSFCLNWAFEQCKNLKIDTHRDNVVMQNTLKKLGFSYCGIIYLLDGDERLAFQKSEDGMKIRRATVEDIDFVAAVEKECFPPAEAASREQFVERLASYADHFWLMFEGDKLISFVDGFVTDEEILTDEMFADALMHNENGAWQMIFGVNTIPSYRRKGYAGQLLEVMIEDARKQGRKGVILTCKEEKIHYYAKFGFVDEGVSEESTHGGAVWHQMRITF